MHTKKNLLLALVAGAAILAGAAMRCVPAEAEDLPATKGSVVAGGMERTFTFYAPAGLSDHPALLIAFHGSGQTGDSFRRSTGYAFDHLADANRFVVVYPDGYGGNWDDCRRAAAYAARSHHIDDMAFVRALIAYFQKTVGADPGRVFAVGYSNGAQMGYRLALEMPEAIRAVAAIGANLPTENNLDCRPSGQPTSVLVMNGTADPINPYGGGTVSIFGFGSRGTVISAADTALYFARLGGLGAAPRTEAAQGGVERSTWGGAGGVEVVLDTITGGGHVVPRGEFDGPTEIWRFFARHMPRSSS